MPRAHSPTVVCGVQDGVMEDEPRQIASHYLRTWFAIDLVACLPVQYVEYAVHSGKSDTFAAISVQLDSSAIWI